MATDINDILGGGSTKPKAGTRKSQVVGGWVIPYIANEAGEWEVDTTQQPTRYLPEAAPARGGAPVVLAPPTRGRGAVVWNEEAQQAQELEGTALAEAEPGTQPIHWQNGVAYQYDPASGTLRALQQDPGTIARLQAQEDRAARAEVRAATKEQGDAEIARINALRQAKQIDDAEAERQWNRWYKENVEAPQAQAKFPLDLAQEERADVTAAPAPGERAGKSAVEDVVAQIPYQFSGGFLERRRQGLEAAQRGMYGPASAAGPNTQPHRGAASR